MSEKDERPIRDFVSFMQGIGLSAESVQRTAAVNASVRRTLDALAGGSLFDTEPAQFDRELRRLGGGAQADV